MQHHAYYIEGSTARMEPLKAALGRAHAVAYERFGIEEARKLIELASLKNYERTNFIIATPSMTTEAQQALLKLFEEPQPGTTFYVIVPHGSLLPTLKSRMLEYSQEIAPQKSADTAKFLHASGKARSDLIAQLLKDDEGARERVRDFVVGLEGALEKKIQDPQAREGLEDLMRVRDYLRDRSPSLKMLLEHLALSLPVV